MSFMRHRKPSFGGMASLSYATGISVFHVFPNLLSYGNRLNKEVKGWRLDPDGSQSNGR